MNNDNQISETFTPRQAATYLAVAYTTLNNSRYTGLLCGVTAPAYLKRGKSIVYKKSTLDTWLGQFKEQTSTSQN